VGYWTTSQYNTQLPVPKYKEEKFQRKLTTFTPSDRNSVW